MYEILGLVTESIEYEMVISVCSSMIHDVCERVYEIVSGKLLRILSEVVSDS